MGPAEISSDRSNPVLSCPISDKIAHGGARSAAHRVPQELFKRVLTFLASEYLYNSATKRAIKQCTLVCRYWARYSRAPLFRRLELRSAADVRQLLQFAEINTLGRNVSDFVEYITLEVTLPTPPWVHQILHTAPRHLFAPKPSREGRSTLELTMQVHPSESDSPSAVKRYTPRSFFHDLPRTLPVGLRAVAYVSTAFSRLHFATCGDLICFVASWAPSRPYAGGLHLSDVTWEGASTTQPATPPPRWAVRRSSSLYIDSIDSSGCTAVWPLAWLLVSTRRSPPRDAPDAPIFVRIEDACCVAALVKAIFDDCQCSGCINNELKNFKLRRPSDTAASDSQHLLQILSIERIPFNHHLVFFISANSGDVTSIRLRTVKYPHSLRPPETVQFPWKTLDDNVGKFNANPAVQIILPGEQNESYKAFIQETMPSTHAAGRLTVDAWNDDVPEARFLKP
ncbi:hypothetical protein PsYK624_128720 [Phanerochaete sordida]|uniref:F-box domain-containing protein n=1 Tax=Phanerochaete sordida TaxID=48140 RepID=A0A9P3LIT4_9APHY|nr:hypothetical protein PsYK624_128720 [Phanerochaete sordida]